MPSMSAMPIDPRGSPSPVIVVVRRGRRALRHPSRSHRDGRPWSPPLALPRLGALSASTLPAIVPANLEVAAGVVGRPRPPVHAGGTSDPGALAPLTLAFREPELERR